MNTNTGFSKREKRLIFAMLIFGAVALTVQFAIIPMNNELEEVRTELEQLEYQQFETQTKLGRELIIRQAYEVAEDDASEVYMRYPASIPAAEIDRFLTNLCFAHGIIPSSLSMSGASSLNIPEHGGQDVFLVVTANMNLQGNYYSIKSLLDHVNTIDNLRIPRISFGINRQEGLEGMTGISATFEITMLAGEWWHE